jgi:predicted small lipoprotein YifL
MLDPVRRRDKVIFMKRVHSLPPLGRRGLGAFLLLAALAGCGRKGDLYMPEDEGKPPPKSSAPGVEPPPAGPAETESLPDVEDDE